MATVLRTCVACGNGFVGRGRAVFCSAACRQRGYRSRKAGDRNAASVTNSGGRIDTVQTGDGVVAVLPGVSTGRVHTAEALAVLAELDGELAENAEELGEQLAWSAAEKTVRELIADTIDRRGGLLQLYQGAENGALRVRLSAELRLLETSLARLLKQVKTDLPQPMTRRSQKAAQAARVRWDRA